MNLTATGSEVGGVVTDLSDPESANFIVDSAIERFGTLTGLVNNAIWIMDTASFTKQTDVDFTRTFDTGPRATFALMKAAYPHLKGAGGGSIVNLGSGARHGGKAGWAAYAGAKEAIRGMTRVAALEWAATTSG